MYKQLRVFAFSAVLLAVPAAAEAQGFLRTLKSLASKPTIPAQFHGRWAPSLKQCAPVTIRQGGRVVDTLPSDSAITVTATGFEGYEAGSDVLGAAPAPAGAVSFRARASAVEDSVSEVITFRMVGNKMSLQRKSADFNSTETYVRCSQPALMDAKYFINKGRPSSALADVRQHMNRSVDFASRFSSAAIPCGTGCVAYYFVDRRTGAVHELSDESSPRRSLLDVKFDRADDRIVVRYLDFSTDTCSSQTFRWTGAQIAKTNNRTSVRCPAL